MDLSAFIADPNNACIKTALEVLDAWFKANEGRKSVTLEDLRIGIGFELDGAEFVCALSILKQSGVIFRSKENDIITYSWN